MKKLFLTAAALCFASTAHAATINGFSDVTDNGGGSYTFIFDTVSSDIDGTGMGLKFTNGAGLDIVATGSKDGAVRNVRQDHPAHGGLGVLGAPNGDNLGVGELLTLTFSKAVNLLGFTLNDGHTDAASGAYKMEVDGGGTLASGAELFDGVGSDFADNGNLCPTYSFFCDINSMTFSSTGFTGYIESVTIQVPVVPLPASLGFLLVGAGGLGIASRKRRNA